MEGWSDDWVKMLETVAVGVEQFFLEATKEMTEALDAFAEFSEDVATQLESAIAPSSISCAPVRDTITGSTTRLGR
jgi:hypothetical protein